MHGAMGTVRMLEFDNGQTTTVTGESAGEALP